MCLSPTPEALTTRQLFLWIAKISLEVTEFWKEQSWCGNGNLHSILIAVLIKWHQCKCSNLFWRSCWEGTASYIYLGIFTIFCNLRTVWRELRCDEPVHSYQPDWWNRGFEKADMQISFSPRQIFKSFFCCGVGLESLNFLLNDTPLPAAIRNTSVCFLLKHKHLISARLSWVQQ